MSCGPWGGDRFCGSKAGEEVEQADTEVDEVELDARVELGQPRPPQSKTARFRARRVPRVGTRSERLVVAEKLLVDVGPKFLEDVADAVVQQRTRPSSKSFAHAAAFLARIITAGNFRCHSAAKNFREIEPAGTRVILGDPEAAYGIACAMEEPSAIKGVIARVLMREGRENSSSKIVLHRGVSKRVPVIAAKARRALMKFRVSIRGLLDARLYPDSYKRRIIESALGGKPELLPGGQRREMRVGAHGLEVRDDAENTLRLLALRIFSRLRDAGRCWRPGSPRIGISAVDRLWRGRLRGLRLLVLVNSRGSSGRLKNDDGRR